MKKKIGIIGGAGPLASCQLYKEIIEECQRYGCKDDSDFPEMIVINYPFSNMLTMQDCENNKEALIVELQSCFDALTSQGVHVAVIACNTLHTLLDTIETKVPIFVNIAQTTLDYAKSLGLKRLLIVGTETTLGLKLYASNTIECIIPKTCHQREINQIIKTVLAGDINEGSAAKLAEIVSTYQALDGVVLGCTELPLLFKKYKDKTGFTNNKITILDTLNILAKHVAQEAFKRIFP